MRPSEFFSFETRPPESFGGRLRADARGAADEKEADGAGPLRARDDVGEAPRARAARRSGPGCRRSARRPRRFRRGRRRRRSGRGRPEAPGPGSRDVASPQRSSKSSRPARSGSRRCRRGSPGGRRALPSAGRRSSRPRGRAPGGPAPYFRFIRSASGTGVFFTTAMSFVKWSPPIGRTAVCASAPCRQTAISVVPPPMSARTMPSSFSSAVRTASLAARGSRTISITSMPARLTQLRRFCVVATGTVTTWTSASRRLPTIPSGSATRPARPRRTGAEGRGGSRSRTGSGRSAPRRARGRCPRGRSRGCARRPRRPAGC